MVVESLAETRSWGKCTKTGGRRMLKFLFIEALPPLSLVPIKQKLATNDYSFKMI